MRSAVRAREDGKDATLHDLETMSALCPDVVVLVSIHKCVCPWSRARLFLAVRSYMFALLPIIHPLLIPVTQRRHMCICRTHFF